MKPLHIALATLTAAVWGSNFIALKVSLVTIPPLMLTALRFVFSALPALALKRPPGLTWPLLLAIGGGMFLGQYAFLFIAMRLGVPPGLASVALQVQALFTVALSVAVLGERPTLAQWIGGAMAFCGLGGIAASAGQAGDIPMVAILFVALSALSWAFGNVAAKIAGPGSGVGTLAGVAWASLIPPIPAAMLSYWLERGDWTLATLESLAGPAGLALAYTVVLSTWAGFAVWGMLLSRYPAAAVAPFALLIPVFGMASAYFVYGETFSAQRLWGAGLIVGGLATMAFWPRLSQLASRLRAASP